MKKKSSELLGIAVAAALVSTTTLAAQLEEVIVTAQKREESMQDVPIAVSAISGDQITTSVVIDVFDLRSVVPSLEIRAVDPPSQGTSFAIRGLGTSVFNMGFEPSVATFVDGVYRARSGIITGSDLVDISRVAWSHSTPMPLNWERVVARSALAMKNTTQYVPEDLSICR